MVQRLLRFFWGSVALFLAVPFSLVQAQVGNVGGQLPRPSTPASEPAQLQNPLSNIDTLSELIEKILDGVVQIGVPVAALFIVYSGFLFVFARGNEEGLKKAKTTLTYTIVGTAVLLGAWTIALIIKGTFGQILG